jgi:hypothetical protein
MKYILMDYVNEGGWPQLSRDEKEHWLGAYRAYMDAMASRSPPGQQGIAAHVGRRDREGFKWQEPGA